MQKKKLFWLRSNNFPSQTDREFLDFYTDTTDKNIYVLGAPDIFVAFSALQDDDVPLVLG